MRATGISAGLRRVPLVLAFLDTRLGGGENNELFGFSEQLTQKLL